MYYYKLKFKCDILYSQILYKKKYHVKYQNRA